MQANVAFWAPIGIVAGLSLVGVLMGMWARRVALPALARALHVNERVVKALQGQVVLWALMLAMYIAASVSLLPPGVADVIRSILLVLLILSVSWSIGKLIALVIRHRAQAGGAVPFVNLLGSMPQFVLVSLGGLVALQSLGISITPLLTALGVGGLAAGLALQDTLANLFAGVHIIASHQVRPGDFVRLESGEEGYVLDVTWRYTTIRQLPNNVTIVPNAKLASAIITNYYRPEPELAVLVQVSVSYASDLAHVEDVTIEVAREVMADVPGGVATFDPFIRYNAFGDAGITFTVILRGREVVDQHLLRHEFIKRLHARYRAEDIEIPAAVRLLQMPQAVAAR